MAARCFWTSGSCSGNNASQCCRSPAIPEFHTQTRYPSSSSYHHLPILTSDSSSRFTGGCRNPIPYPYPHLHRLFAQLPPQSDPADTRSVYQVNFAGCWMSLFFWYSAWDGRNKGGGGGIMPNKRSRSPFRR
ncbi:unnamed protein product [Linum trigynum]|uniref:Uncharacterized protein n=1 Tax=Linum trigynum TaxID=586398 RepID=A0AAV2FRV1_9ROSI